MSTVDDYSCLIDTDTDGMVRVPAAPSQTSPDDQIVQCTVPLVRVLSCYVPRCYVVIMSVRFIYQDPCEIEMIFIKLADRS